MIIGGPGRFFYGWWLLGAAVIATALGSGVSMWAFGLYIGPLEAEFGWSRAEVSLGFSVSLLLSGLSGPLVGKWVDTRGPRSAIVLGGALTALTYLLLATTSALWQWYLYLSVNAVFRQMMLFIPFQALISRWFDRRRGVALGIFGTGFSLGGLLVVPLMRWIIDVAGWDGSFLFSGAIIAGIFIPVGVVLVRNSPGEVGAVPDGLPHPTRDDTLPQSPSGLTLGQTLGTPLFWVIALAMMLFFSGIVGWLVHQVAFYESVGIPRGTAALLVAVAAGCGILPRLTFGLMVDRIARVEAATLALTACLMAGMTALLLDSGALGIAVFLVFWILGSGGGPLLEPLLVSRAFGLAHFGTILGALGVIETFGLISSPVIAGLIFDATGSYDWVLVLFLGVFAAACLLLYLATRLPLPTVLQAPQTPAAP